MTIFLMKLLKNTILFIGLLFVKLDIKNIEDELKREKLKEKYEF